MTVQPDGQIPLPQQVSELAGIEPGMKLVATVEGDGVVRLIALPDVSPDDLRALYPIDDEIDWGELREAGESDAAQEFIERFQ